MAINKKEKLSLADRIFWKNFFHYLLIVAGAVFLFSFNIVDGERTSFDLHQGFTLVSLVTMVWLGGKIAMKFSNYEKLNDYREKMNMTNGQFREKYGDVLDILDH